MYSASTITAVVFLSLFGCIERINFTPLEEEPLPPMLTPSGPVLRFPRNNSYLGSVHTGALRPMFQWEASAWSGQGLVLYELQISNDPTFETEVTVVKTSGTSHQPISNLLVSLVPPVGARYFWRVKACVEDACSEPSPSWWVNLGRVERDLNGDGFADVVAASSGSAGETSTAGRLYVYLGGAGNQFNTQADSVFVGSGNVWYRNAAALGDFNADGFSDLALRVTMQNNQSSRVFVYLGGAGSVLDPTADYLFTADDCAAIGDVNRDGFDDLWIPGSLVLGHATTPQTIPWMTRTVRGAGDVNGDGFADLTVQVPNEVSLHFGSAMPVVELPNGVLKGRSCFGCAVASAGDVNGDGFADLVLGESNDQTAGQFTGRSYVFFGAAGSTFDINPDGVMNGQPYDFLGLGVGPAGDLNGDGFDDVGIRLARDAYVGGIRLYFGGPGSTFDTTYDTQLLGVRETNFFGKFFAAADVNGDGFDDLVSGAPGYQPNPGTDTLVGAIYVYLGAAGQVLEPFPDATMTGLSNGDAFGAVATDNVQLVFP